MNNARTLRLAAAVAALLVGPRLALAAPQTDGGSDAASPLVNIEFGLYFAPEPKGDVRAAMKKACADPHHPFALVEAPGQASPTASSVVMSWKPIEEYAPPDPEGWAFRTRDLSEEVERQVYRGKRVLILDFLIPRGGIRAGNLQVERLVAELAEALEGLPWDEESRSLMSRRAFRKIRIDSWQGEVPDVSKQIVMDLYEKGDSMRVVTMGMRKFGLPDLAATEVSRGVADGLSLLINTAAQTMIERGAPAGHSMKLEFVALQHKDLRERLQRERLRGATGVATLVYQPIPPQEGDPKNDLLDIDFDAPGKTRAERQFSAVRDALGIGDHISGARDDDTELNGARDRARARLPELRERFNAGLKPGESIHVKAPFDTDSKSVEWMWVEVRSWKKSAIEGILLNTPDDVKALRQGASVRVDDAKVFDFMWQKADGTHEGGETSEILMKREGAQ